MTVPPPPHPPLIPWGKGMIAGRNSCLLPRRHARAARERSERGQGNKEGNHGRSGRGSEIVVVVAAVVVGRGAAQTCSRRARARAARPGRTALVDQ